MKEKKQNLIDFNNQYYVTLRIKENETGKSFKHNIIYINVFFSIPLLIFILFSIDEE